MSNQKKMNWVSPQLLDVSSLPEALGSCSNGNTAGTTTTGTFVCSVGNKASGKTGGTGCTTGFGPI